MNKPTNLLERQTIPKGTWCRCASALNLRSVLKETKAFLRAKPNTIQKNIITLLDLERKEDSIPKPLAQESFVTKSLRVDRRNTFPKVREGDRSDSGPIKSLKQPQ